MRFTEKVRTAYRKWYPRGGGGVWCGNVGNGVERVEMFGKVQKGAERDGKAWKGVKRCGKVWRGVERCRKAWKGVERCGEVWGTCGETFPRYEGRESHTLLMPLPRMGQMGGGVLTTCQIFLEKPLPFTLTTVYLVCLDSPQH